MPGIVIDTQIAVWYFENSSKLSNPARHAFDDAVNNGERIILATISIVEIIYLVEKGRLVKETLERLFDGLKLPDSSFRTQALTAGIAETLSEIPRSVVPDMPDRIIAATALHLNLPLISSDGNIRKLDNIEIIW